MSQAVEITGSWLSVSIGASPVILDGVQNWKAQDKVERLDGQTGADQGYSHPYPGTRSVNVSMSLVIDIAQGDLTTIQPGTTLTNVGLYTVYNAPQPVYAIPKFLVLDASPAIEVNGRLMQDVQGENQGPFTRNNPSGSEPPV